MIMLRRGLVAAGLLGAVLFGAMPAMAADDTYQGVTVVTGNDEENRPTALANCLEQVLVKVSGDPRLLGDPRIAPLKAHAADYVTYMLYHDRMSGIPLHDEQGTRQRPFDLFATFDHAKIDAALHDLGLAPWTGTRPKVVMLVAVHDPVTTYVLASDGERGLAERGALADASFQRGIPTILPDTRTLKAIHASYESLTSGKWNDDWQAMSQAGGTAILIGKLAWDEAALGWVTDWNFGWNGKPYHWQARGSSFDGAFRRGMEGVAQIASGHGQPD